MATKATDEMPLVLSAGQVNGLLSTKGDTVSQPRLLDATWFMPNVDRIARREFEHGPRLPGAQFWGVDEIAAHKEDVDAQGRSLNPLGLGHMMPTPERFAQAAGQHGITPATHVIVYDTHGIFSSPRTAFTFYAFGHRRLSILDGGLPAWLAAGLPVEEGAQQEQVDGRADYPVPTMTEGLIRSYDEVVANARMGAASPRRQAVLDARPTARFDGTAPEPRPGLSSGHIPHSLSLPFSALLQQNVDPRTSNRTYTTLKSQTELWRAISDAVGGLDVLDKLRQASSAGEPAAVNTCGSGMTAAILWLGLYQLGVQSSIYDESWTGYAQRKQSVIDKTQQNVHRE